MTLLLNKFAHPWFILCVKKHEWKWSIAANKTHFLQPMLPLKVCKCRYHQTICAVKSHLAHLQHSKSLEKYESKEKLFEWNVWIFRIFIRFCTYSKNSQSLLFVSNSANSILKNSCSLKHLLTVKFSCKENTVCKCYRNTGHFLCCVRPFALHH